MEFVWTEDCDKTFKSLKDALCQSPVLTYPMADGKFVLDTDASNTGTGGVLSQIQSGQKRVIAFGNNTLTKQQRRYCVTRREILAVITFLHQFRHYLLSRKFSLRTDHS